MRVGRDWRTGKPWERIASWSGCKLHLVADAKHEIPVAFSVGAGFGLRAEGAAEGKGYSASVSGTN